MEDPKHQSTDEAAAAAAAEEEFIAKPNPAESSPMIKQKSLLKMKKMLVPKEGSNLKSKVKQVISQESEKSSRKKKRTRVEDLYNNDEAKLSVMERVEEVLDGIADECPSFVKCMLPSNVSHGFWLFLPKKFCCTYLPMHDSTIILVGECGKEYEANYLVDRHGLSGGWRAFSLAQRILKGDLLVFQLIRPCTLKVHIVRVYGLDEVDAALCLMNIVSQKTCSGKKMRTKRKAKKTVQALVQWDTNKNDLAERSVKNCLITNQAKTDSVNLGSEVLEGSEISDNFSKGSRVRSQRKKPCSSFKAHKVASSPALQVAK